MSRIKRVESKREQEKEVDEFRTRGYKIKQQSQYIAKVKEKDWGDPPTHVFIIVLAFVVTALIFNTAGLTAGGVWGIVGLATISYAAYSWYTSEEVIIKVE